MDALDDTALDCLLLIALARGVRAEEISLACRIESPGNPTDRRALPHVAAALALDLEVHHTVAGGPLPCPLPAIAGVGHDGWAVLIHHGAGQVVLRYPAATHAITLTEADFAQRFNGRLLAVIPRAPDKPAAHENSRHLWTGCRISVWSVAEILLATAVLQLLGIVTPLVFQTVIDKVLVSAAFATLDVMCVALCGVALFESLIGFLRGHAVARLGATLERHAGAAFMRRLLDCSAPLAARWSLAGVLARARDLEMVRGFLTGSVLGLLPDLLFCIVFVAVMFHFSAPLAMGVLLMLPCLAASALLPGHFAARAAAARQRQVGEVQGELIETAGALLAVKALGVEDRQLARWRLGLANHAELGVQAADHTALAAQTSMLVQRLALAGLLWLGAREVMQGGLTVGALVALNLLAARVLQPVQRFLQCGLEYRQIAPAWQRLREFATMPSESIPDLPALRVPAPKGVLSCAGLSYRHTPQTPWVLRNVEFNLRPGERLAITGARGTGKTTLLKLLLGLHPPCAGDIALDNVPVTARDPRWLRRHTGFVMSDLPLLAASPHEIIALRHPLASRAEVEAAARAAGVDTFVQRLPQGYDTPIPPEHQWSSREAAHLRVARALLGVPPLVLCDHGDEIAAEILTLCGPTQICVVVISNPTLLERVDWVLHLEAPAPEVTRAVATRGGASMRRRRA